MLAQANRLKKQKDFKLVFKEGKIFRDDFLILKTRKNKLREFRIGIVVSRKISPKAVVRNRIKRRLRGIVKGRIKEIKKGIDIVLITLPGIEERNFLEIKEIIEKIFKKADILNP